MKIKLLTAGLLALASTTAFAQKGELNKAKEEYQKYESTKEGLVTVALKSLNDAKTAIDKAAAHEKTANLPLTFAVKGVIYAALASRDSVETTAAPLQTAASEALKKAQELDTKKDDKELTEIINNGNRYLAQYSLNQGVKQYQGGKYALAYTSFDAYRQILPEDTNAIYYTALSAANAGREDAKFLPMAISGYQKLLTTNYTKKEDIYNDLASTYLMSKDTAGALKTVSEGVQKFPSNASLRSREIEINLVQGKEADAVSKIEAAIANSPKDKNLYYYGGITYAKVADLAAKDEKKAKTPAAKAPLSAKKEQSFTKSAEMYKKALEIDPNYADAALNLGFVMVNPAIEAYNAANALPVNKQKEYEAAVAKANKLFDAAKPYLDKAVTLNPKSPEALNNLKTYYLGKKDTANANKIQKQIEAL
ncbi:tetratricopeptide repeat protein [Mucilaginibacter sp. JRF]|uniref:tetratricopeptide repeat protein n=1 Tax=Mucilaginibacter sp. JRF TaxID=2780088 RepID=UPI0018800425|nr:tetratricopeptide repeat protein [Mucilaginibacter sp. JRF]MBE9583645.1 tetratricopeptide repeat protein [Mucilaginibacter sp. JRF]